MRIIEKIANVFYKNPSLRYLLLKVRPLLSKFYQLLWKKTFLYNGKNIKYIYHPYNASYNNERKVEIALAKRFLEEECCNLSNKNSLLEVWNVLSHYISVKHLVIDKYEKDWYMYLINKDILEYSSYVAFDRVISISTIEHIWFDEWEQNWKKSIKAIKYILDKLLVSWWKAFFTFPWWYNPELDRLLVKIDNHEKNIVNDICIIDSLSYIYRKDKWEWEQVFDTKDIISYTYWKRYNCANAIAILELTKKYIHD